MYELIILGQLMRITAHGYLIAKIINNIIGPYARISNGRLYPLLAKLEQSGLITPYTESGPQNDRQLRAYEITEAGKRRFHELMMDTMASPGEYKELFAKKAAYLDLLKPGERLRLLDHYINYCQIHILHLTATSDHIVQDAPQWGVGWQAIEASALCVTDHMISQWKLELEWAKNLREQELAQISFPQMERGDESKPDITKSKE